MFQEMQEFYEQQAHQKQEKMLAKQQKREEALNYIKKLEREKVSRLSFI